MEWLFILGLMIALGALAGRLRAAERRIAELAIKVSVASAFRESDAVEEPHTERATSDRPKLQPWRASTPTTARGVTLQEGEREESVEPAASDLEMGHSTGRRETADVSAYALDPTIEAESAPAPHAFRIDLEDMFGRRLPIWAGGIALAVAGVFLVRYSIEQGLVTPLLRVIMAFVFGFALIGAGEAAYRLRERVADPRVGQALAGAGLATLYAAFYLAGTQYGLIGQTLAFIGLAAVTAGAIALSFRFGLPSAVLGLVGGFAAPLLVGGEEANLPLLALYLGLVTTGLTLSGRRQQRSWIGVTALVGGLGWGAVLLMTGEPGAAEVIALGLYLVVLGAILPALAGEESFEGGLRLAAAFVASVQLALLVDQAGYSPLVWSFYLLLGATLALFGWRRPDLREASAIAAAVAVILLAQMSGASGGFYAAVALAITAVFAGVPLALVWRGQDRPIDVWQIAGVSIGLAAVTYSSFGDFATDGVEGTLALVTLALAALPALAAWRISGRGQARDLAIAMAASAALAFASLLMLTPGWAAPLAAAAVFAVLLSLLRARIETPLIAVLWGAALLAVGALLVHVRIWNETEHLFGLSQDKRGLLPFMRWFSVGTVFAALAWRERRDDLRHIAEGAGAFLAYATLAQLLPRDALAWSAALLAIGCWFALRSRIPAQLVALTLAGLWALDPLGWWLEAGLESWAGNPVLVGELPGLGALALQLLPALAALAVVRGPLGPRGLHTQWLALPLAIVCAHILFKQIFAIGSPAEFVALGLAERTLWEALLIGAAWLAASGLPRVGPQQRAAVVLASAAVAHFALYTGLLHNPLWAAQALGTLPIANLALPAYATAIGGVLLLRRWSPERFSAWFDGAVMLLASLAVLTLLRQIFGGSIPALVPLNQTEDLLRSLAGIVLALAFLALGSRTGERSWRVGSLVIMLAAVAKVFLIDAAGLDGLLRVASFMALGFSLIGIGWVYTRQLRARPAVQ